MRTRTFLILAGFTALGVARATADTVTWQGVNTSANSGYNNTNVNDATLWSPPQVPGPADHAVFDFNDTRAESSRFWRPIVIPPDGTFAPGSLAFICGTYNGPITVPIYLQDDLEMTSLSLNRGYSSGGQSERVFRIGTSGNDVLAGPVYFTTTNAPAWNGDFAVTGYKGGPVTYALQDYGTVTAFRDAVNANTGDTGVSMSIASSGANRTLSFVSDVGGADIAIRIDTTAVIGTNPIVPLYWGHDVNGIDVYGLDAVPATVTLNGPEPIAFANTKGCWANLYLAADSTLVFSSANITFPTQPRASYMINFGLTGDTGAAVEFPAVGGSVTLGDPATRSDGNLWLHSPVALKVRSDQTWLNPTGLGFLRVTLDNGATVIHALDSQPLANMGQVALWLSPRDRSQSYTFPAGSFQGIRYTGAITSGGSVNQLTMAGPVTLTGATVRPGDNSATGVATLDPDYSLYLSTENRMEVSLNLAGHTLTTAMGIQIDSPYAGTTYEQRTRQVNASGSTLTVGGDIFVSSTRMYAGFVDSTLRENLRMGVTGDADTIVNLHGSFRTMMRAMSPANGLTLARVNALGGTALEPEGWEVTADPTGTSFGVGSGAIGALYVGSAEAEAHYRLTNEFVNDNDPTNPAKTKDGEVLLANRLALVNGALDLDGHGVKLAAGTTPLEIAATATLDLHTGLTLAVGDRVAAFVGLGDQTAAWTVCKARVKDTSNPALAFKPLLHTDGNTYWEAVQGGGTLVTIR